MSDQLINQVVARGIEVKMGGVRKGFAGTWCRRDTVYLDGREIGFFQVRRLYHGRRIGHRIECLTAAVNVGRGCVMGSQLDWLLRQAGAQP